MAIVSCSDGCGYSNNGGSDKVTFRLTSNSMSPALFGPHHHANCEKCGHTWKIAAETIRPGSESVPCAICQSKCSISKLQLPGQTVSAKKLPPDQVPNRFDVIVFSAESDNTPSRTAWACKRVWGLPGETIELRDGDLLVDGKPFKKSPEQMLSLAIPLTNYPAVLNQAGNESKLFTFGSSGSSYPKSEGVPLKLATGASIEWREPVVDDYPEDASTPRNLIPVDDLLLDIEFENHRDSQSIECVVLEFAYRGVRQEVHCFFGKIDSHAPPSLPANTDGSRNSCFNVSRIYCGGWDGEQQFWINHDIEGMQLQKASRKTESTQAVIDDDFKFSLKVLNGPVYVKRLSVYRDIYLRADERDLSNGSGESIKLGTNEFLVIGDNLPNSKDSRNGLGLLRRKLIWGVVE